MISKNDRNGVISYIEEIRCGLWYTITPKANLHNDSYNVKQVRYDVINPNKIINITILSMKGTSHKEDI